ncbi:MAG: imidazole glycerol phosphate synthase subunit HisH [Candidatus Bathyarchaeia archaeon]|nr:imidazole glycerol phosphate synthase subunit HisH [Candidatus Bathyarchaeota archaeon]
MPKIAILNYGVGNLKSVSKALENCKVTVKITNKLEDIKDADAIVLPGVGAFKEAIEKIKILEFEIKKFIESGKFILGICLGLQLLFTKSFEGGVISGLNLLKGTVVKLPETVKIPHIGWNTIKIIKYDEFLNGIKDKAFMYFVHSYIAKPEETEVVLSTTNYGEVFPSIVAKNNIYATQFHPEKSGSNGLKILENFVHLIKK